MCSNQPHLASRLMLASLAVFVCSAVALFVLIAETKLFPGLQRQEVEALDWNQTGLPLVLAVSSLFYILFRWRTAKGLPKHVLGFRRAILWSIGIASFVEIVLFRMFHLWLLFQKDAPIANPYPMRGLLYASSIWLTTLVVSLVIFGMMTVGWLDRTERRIGLESTHS
jgi:hypothetical protein